MAEPSLASPAGEIAVVKVGDHHRIPLHEFKRLRDSLVGSMSAATSADIEADLHGA